MRTEKQEAYDLARLDHLDLAGITNQGRDSPIFKNYS
jgi:hypothetical protein